MNSVPTLFLKQTDQHRHTHDPLTLLRYGRPIADCLLLCQINTPATTKGFSSLSFEVQPVFYRPSPAIQL